MPTTLPFQVPEAIVPKYELAKTDILFTKVVVTPLVELTVSAPSVATVRAV